MTRLQVFELECRTNPSGPSLVDPLGLPVVTTPPAPSVPSAPSTPDTPAPNTIQSIINAIIITTITALTPP